MSEENNEGGKGAIKVRVRVPKVRTTRKKPTKGVKKVRPKLKKPVGAVKGGEQAINPETGKWVRE
jgi:hypothetical protein